jgi:hypothetical protein
MRIRTRTCGLLLGMGWGVLALSLYPERLSAWCGERLAYTLSYLLVLGLTIVGTAIGHAIERRRLPWQRSSSRVAPAILFKSEN